MNRHAIAQLAILVCEFAVCASLVIGGMFAPGFLQLIFGG